MRKKQKMTPEQEIERARLKQCEAVFLAAGIDVWRGNVDGSWPRRDGKVGVTYYYWKVIRLWGPAPPDMMLRGRMYELSITLEEAEVIAKWIVEGGWVADADLPVPEHYSHRPHYRWTEAAHALCAAAQGEREERKTEALEKLRRKQPEGP